MNNLKIRQKFIILSFIAVIFLLLIGWVALKINRDGFVNSNNIVIDFKATQKIQADYIEDLFKLRETILSLVISPNDDYKTKVDKEVLPLIDALDKKFLNGIKIDKKYWQEYKKLILKTREYSLNSFDEGAFMNTSTSERHSFYSLINVLKQLQEEKLKNSQKKLFDLKQNFNENNLYIIFGILFIGLIGLILDITVIMKLIKGIESVQKGLIKFFKYLKNPTDYKGTLYINLNSNDELGLMSKAINKEVKMIKKNLQDDYKLIYQAIVALKELKKGQFGNRLSHNAKSTELNVLKNVINKMIDNLENKIQEEMTQRTKQEKLMLQQSKLAAMGEMIGNIAHQWRQPISEINAVLMEVEAMTRYGNNLSKDHLLNSIKTCNKITEHMSTTISDFQNFFKPTKEKENFSILNACKKAVEIIKASLNNNDIKLILNIKEDRIINGYSNEFSHAVLNIISNAKDVLVSRNIKEPKIFINLKVGKKYTVLKIEDNAGGIELDNIDTIFEPYFTTKHIKQGTGIGLYMTKMIIENNMQGFVNVINTNNGALFIIKIK